MFNDKRGGKGSDEVKNREIIWKRSKEWVSSWKARAFSWSTYSPNIQK